MADNPISKMEAAQRHLDMAIYLTFLDKDPLPIHTIAMAALGVLQDLADKKGVLSQLEDMIRPEKLECFRSKVRQKSNFLKHADRDPNSFIEPLTGFSNDAVILNCIEYFDVLGGELTPYMTQYRWWFCAMYPHLMLEGRLRTFMETLKFDQPGDRSAVGEVALESSRRDGGSL